MKRFATTIATLMFAGTVSAADESFIYHGFEVNNPDLYSGYAVTEAATAVQPGIGDRSHSSRPMSTSFANSYETYTRNNPDQYSGVSRSDQMTAVQPGIGDRIEHSRSRTGTSSDSYDAWVAGNPDQESSF